MKLEMPNGDVILDSTLSFDERKIRIEKLLDEVIEFHSEEISAEEYFRRTWDNPSTKACLDMIGYYLTKNNRNEEEIEADRNEDGKDRKEDRYVLSNKKTREMSNGSYRHTTFSSMGVENRIAVGAQDVDDSNFN